MSLTHSAHVPDALRAKLDETDCLKAIRANQDDFAMTHRHWTVEYAREDRGVLEAWLFLEKEPGRDAAVIEHIHLTVHPDKSETTVSVAFLVAGPDRVRVKHHAHGVVSPN